MATQEDETGLFEFFAKNKTAIMIFTALIVLFIVVNPQSALNKWIAFGSITMLLFLAYATKKERKGSMSYIEVAEFIKKALKERERISWSLAHSIPKGEIFIDGAKLLSSTSGEKDIWRVGVTVRAYQDNRNYYYLFEISPYKEVIIGHTKLRRAYTGEIGTPFISEGGDISPEEMRLIRRLRETRLNELINRGEDEK